MLKVVCNAVLFQAGWILSVLYGNPVAMIVAGVTIATYLTLFRRKGSDFLFILIILLIGWIGDSVLGLTGLLVYPNNAFYPPFWLITLWLLFATSLTWSLEWIVQRKLPFIIFCAIGGTLSYVIGVRLSEVTYGKDFAIVISMLATIWTIYGIVIHNAYLWWRKGADLRT